MTLDQIKQQCLRMKAGEERTFTLDEEPARGELASLTIDLNDEKRDGTIVSFRRTSRTLYAQCTRLEN